MSRFPSWTKIFSDSLEKSTPQLALPETNAGKIVNALLGEDLDNVDRLVSDIDYDSYISTADINQVAWLYVTTSLRPGFIKVYGDQIELARVSSFYDLLQQSFNDFVFYYDFVTQDLYTIRPFTEILVDGVEYSQIPVQNYNSFDELGLRVGLQRLFLESNLNFKKRILDVYLNPPSVNIEGLKRTLRRELDIWRAYGSTPDSNYLGATPEILEISDIKSYNNLYFSDDGNQKDTFYDFVENVNTRFPSNLGYAKWGETYWDYAGLKQEGISSIPQITDIDNVSGQYYQSGVGDFDDAKIILEPVSQDLQEYSFAIKAKGIKSDETQEAYEPIIVGYESYVSYYEDYIDNEASTVKYDLYLKLDEHGDIPQNSVYKASFTDYVKNYNNQFQPSSPEYIVKEIFGPSLFSSSDILFVNEGSTPYQNIIFESATESYNISQIPLSAVNQATINYIISTDSNGATGDYSWIQFMDSTPSYSTSTNQVLVKNFIEQNPTSMAIKVSSKIWNEPKTRVTETPRVRSSLFGNTLNESNNFEQTNDIIITPSLIKKSFLLPLGSTPLYVHINNVVDGQYDIDYSSSPNEGYGAISANKEDENLYLIPSSPNIIAGFINPNFSTPQLHENYIETSGSTVKYYFTNLKFPYDNEPDLIYIESASNNYYPFVQKIWQNFEAEHNESFVFYMSENGIEKSSPDIDYSFLGNKKSNLIGEYNFYRSDFGLEEYDSSSDLIIKSLEIVNENDNVIIWQENDDTQDQNSIFNYYDSSTDKFIVKDIKINAQYDLLSNKYISPSIRSGWYFQDEEQRYIYSRPKVKVYNNQEDINLEEVVRNGAPIILEVEEFGSTPVQFRRVSFYDEATPYILSDYNFEYIEAKNVSTLYVSYSDIFDVSVIDTYTGQTILESGQFLTNKIEGFLVSNLVIGRTYKVTYKINNSYYIDNEDYDQITDEYQTKIHIITSPEEEYSATVTYESAIFDRDYEVTEMKLNPVYTPIDEGFIFISHDEYELGNIELNLSPKKIIADGIDYCIVTVISKDKNGNPKPYQSFFIDGNNVSITPPYITTDEDGFGMSKILYSGSTENPPAYVNITVTGLEYPQENSHPNSTPNSISDSVNIYLQKNIELTPKIYADVDKKIANANGIENINIFGSATANSQIYWRKSRNIYDLFTMPYSTYSGVPGKDNTSGMVTVDNLGSFEIGSFISQSDATPGYWFVSVESENASTPNSNPITISGDVLYWYEKYDANQASTEEPSYIPIINESSAYQIYSADPIFKSDPITGDIFIEDNASTPWQLPKWYTINRFTQYQIGLLGTNPDELNFDLLHPDFKEE